MASCFERHKNNDQKKLENTETLVKSIGSLVVNGFFLSYGLPNRIANPIKGIARSEFMFGSYGMANKKSRDAFLWILFQIFLFAEQLHSLLQKRYYL